MQNKLIGPPSLPNNTAVIYGLADPRTREIRYVGYTTNPKQRYKDHRFRRKPNGPSEKELWIDELDDQGMDPVMVKIGYCRTDRDWYGADDYEEYWISTLANYGEPLTNVLWESRWGVGAHAGYGTPK